MAKDPRLYAKFDIGMDEHPKIMMLSDAAFRALIESTLYSRRQLTDGFIDVRVASKRWSPDVCHELSSNDASKPSWVVVDGGYQIHDFGEHQTTTADIKAKREAGRRGGLAKASKSLAGASEVLETATSDAVSKSHQNTSNEGFDAHHDVHQGVSNDALGDVFDSQKTAQSQGFLAGAREVLEQKASTTLAKTETETETKDKKTSSNAAHSKEFETFWAAYPRKVGKLASKASFDKAKKLATLDQILSGVELLRKESSGKETTFIPHPATWLNQGRWDDEPSSTPSAPSASSPWSKEFYK